MQHSTLGELSVYPAPYRIRSASTRLGQPSHLRQYTEPILVLDTEVHKPPGPAMQPCQVDEWGAVHSPLGSWHFCVISGLFSTIMLGLIPVMRCMCWLLEKGASYDHDTELFVQ
ncbi:hypothetical protein BDV18DRAFT_133974 [Aspergillus unguis]